MADLEVRRTQPEGAAPAVALRRLREAPSLGLPLVLLLAAAGLHVAAAVRGESRLETAAWMASGYAAISAFVVRGVRAYLGRRFSSVPSAPDDDPEPVPVRWLDAPPGAGRAHAARFAHLLPGGIRIVGECASARDLTPVAVATLVGGAAAGWAGLPAALAVAWGFGFPRPARIAAEIPWDDLAEVRRTGPEHFRFVSKDGRVLAVIEARYAAAERLSDRLAERIGNRVASEGTGLAPELRPAVLQPAEGDEDAGTAELVFRRIRGRWALAAALALLGIACVLFAASYVFSFVWLRVAAGGAALLGGVFALAGGGSRQSLWRGTTPAAGDAPDPVPVRWTNRPGLPGPGPQQVHLLPHGMRVLAYEWEPWDILVVVAAGLAVLPAGGGIAAAIAVITLTALGIPRRRRYVVDIAWTDVVRAEVRGVVFEVRSTLPSPADVVRFEARFSARERLTSELIERLGARAEVVHWTGSGG